jgi:ribonucleoside-diphosphate reductase alpha chain
MNGPDFKEALSRRIWETKYRYREGAAQAELGVRDTWRRIARALAAAEHETHEVWEERFYRLLDGFRFLPGGRILAGAGTGLRVTLFNCFVMGTIEDSMDGIFTALKEGALTMQEGGGVGYDFSTLRPAGDRAWSVGGVASGPVSFMRIWDSMCATLLSTGARRGAMMATLRCDHPDILPFIEAKRDTAELRHFNLSVLISDDFMRALHEDGDWALLFPLSAQERGAKSTADGVVLRRWSGTAEPVPCGVHRTIRARELWERLMRASYDYAEPGVLFMDRINESNNLHYREWISATNPCGEIPLPPYGACDLGSLNLTRFVREPFTEVAALDLPALAAAAGTAVRMLDNVIDASRFPLSRQRDQALLTRRIGLGITGLADALLMLGIRYGEPPSFRQAAAAMETVCHAAYRASAELAREKAVFPAFDRDRYMRGPFIRALPGDLQEVIATMGVRNSHLIAIAPTGTISLLADNVSSGLEPVYKYRYKRRLRQTDGTLGEFEVVDYACRLWQETHAPDSLPPQYVAAHDLPPEAHLQMQAAIQPYVDNAISKTINIPENLDFSAYQSVYERAYALGLKGCTTFRPNPVTGMVLYEDEPPGTQPHCCGLDREPD